MHGTVSALPEGQRYVRYGTMSRGKFHIMHAQPTPRADGYTRPEDYDALCGFTDRGLSPCTATLGVLRDVDWTGHVCKRCIARLSDA